MLQDAHTCHVGQVCSDDGDEDREAGKGTATLTGNVPMKMAEETFLKGDRAETGRRHVTAWGKGVPHRRKSKCKAAQVDPCCQVSPRLGIQAAVAGGQGAEGQEPPQR